MIVIPQGPFDESLDRALLRLAADVRRTWDWSTRLLVLVIFAPRARRAAMFVPLLRGVGVNAMRSRDHDLLALIVVRLIVIPVAGADEPVTAFILVDLGGELPVVVEVVCAPASMADATLSSDWRGTPMGPCTDRPPGSGDVRVLVIRLIILLDVGAGSQEGLNEGHTDPSPGPRPVHELAAGAFRDEPAAVREDDDHQVSVRPHPQRGRPGLDETPPVRHHELPVGNHETKGTRKPVAHHTGQG